MTSLLEGAKKLVTRSPDIGTRIDGLEAAVTAARGRLDTSVVDNAQLIVDQAAGRLRLAANYTVVGIAGATGSGKSSTFNALTELELSATGVRRPTTSWASACVWGDEDASDLLEWLGIPPRYQTTRDSVLQTGREDNSLRGVVLLDLPDHDSTEVSHHLEVDRLVQLADLLIWVLDPQKYADAAIHERYLAPLSTHQDVTMVVLNQMDTVPADRRMAMLDDVRRLLAADGMTTVPVMGISA
ncbi:MAG: GTPase, partial [Nocardioides sp.]